MPNINDVKTLEPDKQARTTVRKWRPKDEPLIPVRVTTDSSVRVNEEPTLTPKQSEIKNSDSSPLSKESNLVKPPNFDLEGHEHAAAPYPTTPLEITPNKEQLGSIHEPIEDLSGTNQGVIRDLTQIKQEPIKDLSGTNQGVIEDHISKDKGEIHSKDQSRINKGSIKDLSGTNQGAIKNRSRTHQESVKDLSRIDQGPNQGLNQGAIEDQAGSEFPSLHHLSRQQRKIVFFIYHDTKKQRSKTTRTITSDALSKFVNTTKDTIRGTIKKLKKKQIFDIPDSKSGPGGWYIFQLSHLAYVELLRMEEEGEIESWLEETDQNQGSNQGPNQGSAPSSSSSFSFNTDNKTTTTTNEQVTNSVPSSSELPEEWQEIDFGELNELEIQFGRPHLKQWFDRNYCTAKEAQESIWHFGYFIRHAPPEKLPKSPLSFLMGIMHRSHYFSPPEGYLSPIDEALKRRAEDLKRQNENLRRLQEEYFEQVFELWFMSLTGAQLQKLVPHFSGYERKKATLKEMFRDEHWVTIRDNPERDVTTLQLKAGSCFEGNEVGVKDDDNVYEVTVDEVKRLSDAQFGTHKN